MRSLKRLVPGLLGLALAIPFGVPAFGQSDAPKHEHKGLMGRRSCVECQRARAKARDGVDVPPPPSAVQHGHGHAHAHAQQQQAALAVAPGSTGCLECEHDAAAMGGTIVPGSIVVHDTTLAPPGRAVVGGGGETVAAQFPTGRAVVGSDPAPIGTARASEGNFTPVAGAMAGPAAPRDSSVLPSSMIPPQTALGGDNQVPRPRIITHMLDLPDLTRIGRVARSNRERARRENHASISYGDAGGPVSELPASMVFGKDR